MDMLDIRRQIQMGRLLNRGRMSKLARYLPALIGSPIPTNNLDLWLKADAITGLADEDAVVTWPDSSPTRNDAGRQSAGAAYVANGKNGRPTVLFSAAGYYETALSASGPEQTVLLAASFTQAEEYQTPVGTQPGGFAPLTKYPDNTIHSSKSYVAGMHAGATVVATGDFHICSSYFSDSQNKALIRIDGANDGTESTYNSSLEADCTVRIGGGNYGLELFNGNICEVIHYARLLSLHEIQVVERYLSAKWGIALA